MKAMTGETTARPSRRDEGGAFPAEAGKRKSSRVGLAGAAKRGGRWKNLLTLPSWQGGGSREKRAERRGDNHQREAGQAAACP